MVEDDLDLKIEDGEGGRYFPCIPSSLNIPPRHSRSSARDVLKMLTGYLPSQSVSYMASCNICFSTKNNDRYVI